MGLRRVLASLVILVLLNRVTALDDFLGPTDPTGQIDFSDGTACACPGSPVQYLCTVSDPSGNSFTRWRGTAFDCTGNQAALFHDQYTADLAAIACNDGNFSLSVCGLTNVTDQCYTSVLTVNIEPGLNGMTVECTFAGSRTIGNDTLEVAVPLPPPSTPQVVVPDPDQSFTVSWAPPTAECGNAVTYMYPDLAASMCGQCTGRSDTPSVTCRGWTAQEQNCSITAQADNCAGMGNESEPVVISFPRPTTPNVTGGKVVFDQSRGIADITVEWGAVGPTLPIAESGGDILLSGTIRDYVVTFISGDPLIVNCASATCTSSTAQPIATSGTNLFIGVAARNAITQGEAGQALCSIFNVERSTESSLLDVTLTCPVAGCTIRYGLDPTYQTLPSEGRSGEPLQNLTAAETYYTEATFICGGLTVCVRDTFDTCECPSSGLFAGAVTEAATCPQEFTGGVRTSSSNGFACYSGLTADSTAVFMCDVDGAECTGVCEAVCVCPSGQTVGNWSASFESAVCIIPSTGLGVGVIIGIVIGVIIGLLLVVAIVALIVWWCCCRPDSGTPKKSKKNKRLTDEEHELREPSPISHDPNALYSNPTDIRHEAAPESHDEYAVLDTHTKKKPNTAPKAQESSELQKQVGPEGDVYTVPVPKRGSSKRKQESPPPSLPPPSEEQLAEMYATPDMSQKGRNKNTVPPLVYADIGVSASSRAAPVPTAGQVTYSTIAGTEPGPVEVVVEPTYAN